MPSASSLAYVVFEIDSAGVSARQNSAQKTHSSASRLMASRMSVGTVDRFGRGDWLGDPYMTFSVCIAPFQLQRALLDGIVVTHRCRGDSNGLS